MSKRRSRVGLVAARAVLARRESPPEQLVEEVEPRVWFDEPPNVEEPPSDVPPDDPWLGRRDLQ